MTTQDWLDLVESVVFIDTPPYSRQVFYDFINAHGGLFGQTFTNFVISVQDDTDGPVPREVWPSWATICTNGTTQWTMMLQSMLFGGGGGVPLDGIFTIAYETPFV